jgi:hypothetical protein
MSIRTSWGLSLTKKCASILYSESEELLLHKVFTSHLLVIAASSYLAICELLNQITTTCHRLMRLLRFLTLILQYYVTAAIIHQLVALMSYRHIKACEISLSALNMCCVTVTSVIIFIISISISII